MTSPPLPYRHYARQAFTLIELLVVLAIAAILMGMVAVAYNSTTGINSTARKVGKQLHLTRQHAITQRSHVALLMPHNVSEEYDHLSFRPCFVTMASGSPVFDGWVEGTAWSYTDSRVILDNVNNTQTCGNVDIDGSIYSVRCVIFKPNGALVGASDFSVDVVPESGSPEVTTQTITVNWLTGRVSYTTNVMNP